MPKPDSVVEESSKVTGDEAAEETSSEELLTEEQLTQETPPAEETEETPSGQTKEGQEAEESEDADPDAKLTAEELRAKLKEAREAAAAKEEPKSEEKSTETTPTPSAQSGEYTKYFLQSVFPAVKQTLTDDKATPEAKFQATFEMTNQLVGAVLDDQIKPVFRELLTTSILQRNEIESLHLLLTDEEFAVYRPEVEQELKNLTWQTRSNPKIVSETFDKLRKLVKSKSNGATKTVTAAITKSAVPSAVGKTLKDVATNGAIAGTKSGGTSSVSLTREQWAELKEINKDRPKEEQMTAGVYRDRLTARIKNIKARNANESDASKHVKVPTTLRGR